MLRRLARFLGLARDGDVADAIQAMQAQADLMSAEIEAMKEREKQVVKHIISLFKHVITTKKDIDSVMQGSLANTELIGRLNGALGEVSAAIQGLYEMVTVPQASAADKTIALPDMDAKKKGELN